MPDGRFFEFEKKSLLNSGAVQVHLTGKKLFYIGTYQFCEHKMLV
jgi:hypothetical protein